MLAKEVSTISVNKIWIFQQSGVCLFQHNFGDDNASNVDENILGGITVSLLNTVLSLGFSEDGMNAISFRDRRLNFYYDDEIIVCMESSPSVKESSSIEAIQKIHKSFVYKFISFIKSAKFVDTVMFASFKEKIFEILRYYRLIPNLDVVTN